MIAKWAQEDLETLDNLLNNNNKYIVVPRSNLVAHIEGGT